MKVQYMAAATAAASVAVAQNTTRSYSTMTVTASNCSNMLAMPMSTITETATVTYCPECDNMSKSGYMTVYTTTYMSLCSTGMVPATYTVTESCSEAMPTWTPGPGYIPQGFTTTVKECHVCGESTSAVTITEPCGCMAQNGMPMMNTMAGMTPGQAPATATGMSSMPTGVPPSASSPNAPMGGKGAGASPAPAGMNAASSPAPAAGGNLAANMANAPYPTPTTMTGSCPGPTCRSMATNSPPGANRGNTTGIMPYTGAASSISGAGLLPFALGTVLAYLAIFF